MERDIVHAWKDEVYRQGLSEEQSLLLPGNPAGELEMTDTDLASICGGGFTDGLGTWGNGEIVNGRLYSFALSCKNVRFSVTVITGNHVFQPITIICIEDENNA